MDRLFLPRALKGTLHEVGSNGGNRDLYVEPDRELLRRLREHFYSESATARLPVGDWHKPNSLDEFLECDRFERRVSYCIIRLRESGVPQSQHFDLIRRAISFVLESIVKSGRIAKFFQPAEGEISSIDDLITLRLSQCFAPWYYPEHILHYEILSEHEMIFWNPHEEAWFLSNLGEYARGLTTFSLLLFLLGIEFNFARSDKRSRYPTRALADNLSKGMEPTGRANEDLPRALKWYGIMEREVSYNGREYLHLTEFGQQLLGAAVQRSEEIRDLVLLLTETEHHGFKLANTNGGRAAAGGLFQAELESNLLSSDEKTSLKEVERLYRSGNTLDALRLIYPLIEALLNSALVRSRATTANQLGMRAKIDHLVVQGLLSPELGNLTEIVASRNKTVHGNLDSRDGLLDPLYIFVAGVFRAMVAELR